ncbi:LysM repeat protein [Glaciihabitans tibetensis]|uniref:LysM repeat protein n=1 Tax=Glaciihabitans tibetensis TaxID=1266600 RepID=A0A2T0VED1_9MICO|nr:LysM peptidoglycan-binding domain-containing protein [Glaciihabitans tibetensis]PRY68539.1 LysM repeat protein [Glaciihabitans tibetensis]
MTEISERNAQPLPSPLAGLKPRRLRDDSDGAAPRERSKISRSMLSTVPIVLAGSLAVAGLGFTGPITDSSAKRTPDPKLETADHGTTQASKPSKRALSAALASANAAASPARPTTSAPAAELAVAEAAPSTYRVQGGDTVSSIAGRFGLSTASVLALNGLGWKSVIFPGQILKLTNAVTSVAPVAAPSASSSTERYTIGTGDTVSSIASNFGVSVQAILSANGLGWSSVIFPGRTLTIPRSGTAEVFETVAMVSPIASTTVTEEYTIRSGDTLGGIATKFGVSVSSLLSANNLSMSSLIFGGQTLKIARNAPAVVSTTAAAVVVTEATATTVTPLSPEMAANATTIVRVGQQLGVPDYGIVIALAAAMQESSLRNVDHGDRDSVGLFQQRPSTGWGTREQLLSPEYSSKLFYGGRDNPNVGITLGLLNIGGWESMSVTDAAQKVQISAYPNAYAKWETSARAWLAALK